MLGLGDEYHDADDEPGQKAWHSGLVEREFGHEVIKGKADPESIMAGGSKVLPEHGVTLLEALRAIVPEATWGHEAKPPKRVPPPRPGAMAPAAAAPARPGDSGGGVPGAPSPPGNDQLPPGLRSEGS